MPTRAAKPTSQKATIADEANSYSRKVREKAKLREEHKATEAEAMMVRVGSIGAGVLASMSTRDNDIATYSADELAGTWGSTARRSTRPQGAEIFPTVGWVAD